MIRKFRPCLPCITVASFEGTEEDCNPSAAICEEAVRRLTSQDYPFNISHRILPSQGDYSDSILMEIDSHPQNYHDVCSVVARILRSDGNRHTAPNALIMVGVGLHQNTPSVEHCSVPERFDRKLGQRVPFVSRKGSSLPSEYAESTLPNSKILRVCHDQGLPLILGDMRQKECRPATCNAALGAGLRQSRQLSNTTLVGFMHFLMLREQAELAAKGLAMIPEGDYASMPLEPQIQILMTAIMVTVREVAMQRQRFGSLVQSFFDIAS
jgi:hypothetical protein